VDKSMKMKNKSARWTRIAFFSLAIVLAACGSRGAASPPADFPATAAESATPNCPSGECLPIGDLPGWRQIFTEDFREPAPPGSWDDCTVAAFRCGALPPAYRDRWWAFLEGWTDNASGLYSPARVISVSGGAMDLFLHSVGSTHLAAAPVPLIHGPAGPLGQLYGRYAVRFRSDSLHGYKLAWLLWPDSEVWPRDGEIDFPEGNLDGPIEAYLHRRDAAEGNDAAGFASGVGLSGPWHTAVIEWTSESVVFLLDGRVVGATRERIPNTPMHWVLEATTTLDGYEPADETAGHVRIDWVAVWEVNGPDGRG
jgi:hypothetical protein